MQARYPVYIVDDDPSIQAWAEILCDKKKLSCEVFPGGEEFLDAVDRLAPGCILLDMRMPRRSGLHVQAEIGRRNIAMPVIAMTGFGDVDVAVESMRLGAVEFLEKPFTEDVLFEALDQAFLRLDAQDGGGVAPAT